MYWSDQRWQKVRRHPGFIAALDQSGGENVLLSYGISRTEWTTKDEEKCLVHHYRTRIIVNPAFDGDRILGAILFEDTLDREIEGRPTADYLWEVKRIVPFLKVDKGLAADEDGVQRMKPVQNLTGLLTHAVDARVFGTKMRSVINRASASGIAAVVDQQFQIAADIIAHGLVPIIEPEININCPQKAEAEGLLKQALLEHLNRLQPDEQVMLKVTLPEQDNFYAECIRHPNVVRVVALSGGYARDHANARLARSNGMVASFSRALVEGLSVRQSEADFNTTLSASIQSIYQASIT